jgi:hypothetical protein
MATAPTALDVVPEPSIVREQLARTLREARLLRRLYRISIAASEELHGRQATPHPPGQPTATWHPRSQTLSGPANSPGPAA